MKIITVFTSFAKKGGAEDMAISIAKGLSEDATPKILHSDTTVGEVYKNCGVVFEKINISIIRKYHKRGYVFLSHHRKSTTLLILISRLLFLGRLRIIHVAHNTFASLRRLSLFPKYNVAVSKTVKENMISYFSLKDNNIKVIYNGIVDSYDSEHRTMRINEDTINILFLGRIDPVKRQVNFVNATKGHFNDNIRIYFGGEGVDYKNLEAAIGEDFHYKMLGLINPYAELYKYDYVCLFSEKEGLPLSLIEAQMFHKPLLTNDIPQCLEINVDKYCGFVSHSWDEVIDCINNLPSYNDGSYLRLAANARSVYDKLFSYNRMIDSYKSFIKSVDWR